MVKQARVLLLDFDPACGPGSALRGVLASSYNEPGQTASPDIRFRQESIRVSEPEVPNNDLSDIVLSFDPDLIFLVLPAGMFEQAGYMIRLVKETIPEIPILIVVEEGKPEEMLELLKLGANDFIAPPIKAIHVLPRLWRLLEQSRRTEALTQTLKEKLGLKQIIGRNPQFLAEVKKIPLIARCDSRILISGETGTGKEIFARAIHYLSPRASKPFMPVNCGAIPVELVESELFGHERGAFTGATTSQRGLIQEADGGTVFLDEIDCFPLPVQVKLLRFLEGKEYRPLGSAKMRKADVRIIAATNIDLDLAVREGEFRRDLYYRLNTIPFMLPPLRERRDDIPVLAEHFLIKYADQFKKQEMDISSDALQKLILHDWPGNVRELEHVIERTVALSENRVICGADILLPGSESSPGKGSFQSVKARVIAQFERNYIEGLLVTYRGNITKAARAAQKNRRAFWQLMRKYGIDAQNYKSNNL